MAFVTNSRSKNSSKRSARNTTFSSCQNLLFQPNPAVRTLKHMSDKNCWKKCLYLCCHQTLSPTHVIKRACNIKWSKLVRTCHSSLQSTLSCHRKPLIPDCKMEIKAETFFLESSAQWSTAHFDQCGRCPECIRVYCITISLPCKALLGARSIVVGWWVL